VSTMPSRIEVRHPGGTYDYWVGHDLLGSHRELAGIEGPTAIVTDQTTAGQYLGTCGEADVVVVLPSGRLEKTLATVQKVHRKLLDARLDRSTTLISLGDSIIGDVTAFAAATYLRGIDVVHIPTELIAMIDTSVGGKVGLDVPHGRNLIGLFKQPRAVIADVTTLRSLSPSAFSAGMSEVVKHALIKGEEMTRQIESSDWDSVESTIGGSTGDLEDLVARAVRVKVDIVAEDPFDEARRQVLNLGHTFAYAFESAMLGDVSHGEAVGIGLVAASKLSANVGLCDPGLHDRVQHLVRHVGQQTSLPRPIAMDAVDRAFAHDKKRRGEEQRFVLLERIGSPVVMGVDDRAAVLGAIESVQP
jgi:shikimate kinase/3-dehydroquinate synthase